MLIRAFCSADFETLYRIDQACFPTGISYSREELSVYIRYRGAKTWVAESDGRIVGFLIACKAPLRAGHIVTIDVIETARRSGIGKAMMQACEDWARAESLRRLSLETAADNVCAQAFYARLGYAKVDEIPGYYSDGTTAWVLVKQLIVDG